MRHGRRCGCGAGRGADLNHIEKPSACSFEANISKLTEISPSVRKTLKIQCLNHTLQGQSCAKRRKKQSKLGTIGALQERKKSNSLDSLNQDLAEETQNSLQPVAREESYRQQYPVSNAEILNFLSSEEAALYLEKVFNKEVQSDRHDIVCKMFRSGKLDFGIHSKIFHLSQVQFLEDDQRIDSKLSDVVSRLFKRIDILQVPEMPK